MSKKETLSNVDAAWLHMEDPTNLMMVAGILAFHEQLDLDKLKDVLEKRLLSFDRFRKKVVDPQSVLGGAPYWEDHEFNWDDHLKVVSLPMPGDHAALQDFASQMMSTPLDFEKPLWDAHYVDNFGSGSALILRIHHCIADGIALVGVLLSLTTTSPDEDVSAPDRPDRTNQPLSSMGNLFRETFTLIEKAGKNTGNLIKGSLATITNPSRIVDLAKLGMSGAYTASKMVLRAADPKTMFKGELGVEKRVAWSRAIPLDDVKAIKNATGATVNDVLITAVAGALRRYMDARDQDTDHLNFRAAVPVNLRDPSKFHELGNHFGLVFLSMPIGLVDPMKRLKVVQKRMNVLKSSPEAIVAFGILKAMGMTPTEIQKIIVNIFGSKTTCVLTNVPGPQEPLYLAGKEIEGQMFWVPQSGRVGLGISILSYANQVRLGIATDAGLAPNPEQIIDNFYIELDDLQTLVPKEKTNKN